MLSRSLRVERRLKSKIYQYGSVVNQRKNLQPASEFSTLTRPVCHFGQSVLFPGRLEANTSKNNTFFTFSSALGRRYHEKKSMKDLYIESIVQEFGEDLKNPSLPLSPLEDGVLSTIFLENSELLLSFLNALMKEIRDGPEITEVSEQILEKIQQAKLFFGKESWLNLTCKTCDDESFNLHVQFRGPIINNEANCRRLVAQATLLHSSQLLEHEGDSSTDQYYSFIYGYENEAFQEAQKNRFKKSVIVYICRHGWLNEGKLISEYQGFINLKDPKDDSLNDVKIIVVDLKSMDFEKVGNFEKMPEIEKWFGFIKSLFDSVQQRRKEVKLVLDPRLLDLVATNPHLSVLYDKLNDLKTYGKLSDEQKEGYTFNTVDWEMSGHVGKLIVAKRRQVEQKAIEKTAKILSEKMTKINVEDALKILGASGGEDKDKKEAGEDDDDVDSTGPGLWNRLPEDLKEQYLFSMMEDEQAPCDYVIEFVNDRVEETMEQMESKSVGILVEKLNISLEDAKKLWKEKHD